MEDEAKPGGFSPRATLVSGVGSGAKPEAYGIGVTAIEQRLSALELEQAALRQDYRRLYHDVMQLGRAMTARLDALDQRVQELADDAMLDFADDADDEEPV